MDRARSMHGSLALDAVTGGHLRRRRLGSSRLEQRGFSYGSCASVQSPLVSLYPIDRLRFVARALRPYVTPTGRATDYLERGSVLATFPPTKREASISRRVPKEGSKEKGRLYASPAYTCSLRSVTLCAKCAEAHPRNSANINDHCTATARNTEIFSKVMPREIPKECPR